MVVGLSDKLSVHCSTVSTVQSADNSIMLKTLQIILIVQLFLLTKQQRQRFGRCYSAYHALSDPMFRAAVSRSEVYYKPRSIGPVT